MLKPPAEEEDIMKKIIMTVLCVLCLFGCGKRGKLDFPKGATYPRQYPAARKPKQKEIIQPVEKERTERMNVSETGEQE